MDSKIIKVLSFLISAFLIVFVVVQMASFGESSDYTAQTVYSANIEETITMEGFFAREETVIALPKTGVFSCNYSVGEKVPVQTLLGSTYENARSFADQYRREDLENNLTALKRAQSVVQTTDAIKPDVLNSALSECTARLISAIDNGDYGSVAELKKNYIETFAKKAIVTSGSIDYQQKIDELTLQLDGYVTQAESSLEDVYATASGYFVDHIDGWEQKVTYKGALEMSLSEFRQKESSYSGYRYQTGAVKVVTSSHWRYLTVLSESEAANIQVGDRIELKFSYISEPAVVTVEKMTRDNETGEYVVAFAGDTMSKELLGTRFAEAQMTVQGYQGLKVPKEALRFNEDGEMGVYVILMDKMHFRKVQLLYETDSYIISKPMENEKGYLKLYDTVITSGTDLYEGKFL